MLTLWYIIPLCHIISSSLKTFFVLNCTSPLYLSTYKLTILFCLTAIGGWMANNFLQLVAPEGIILQTSKVFPILLVSKSELETLAHPFVSSGLIFCNALKLM